MIDQIQNQTHPEIKDYWTPLYEEEDEADDEEERQHEMNVKETTKKKNKPRNRPGGRQRSARAKQKIKVSNRFGSNIAFFMRRELTKDWRNKYHHISPR